jgi:hypothetical protein
MVASREIYGLVCVCVFVCVCVCERERERESVNGSAFVLCGHDMVSWQT